jgi:hypothetical protein
MRSDGATHARQIPMDTERTIASVVSPAHEKTHGGSRRHARVLAISRVGRLDQYPSELMTSPPFRVESALKTGTVEGAPPVPRLSA